MSLFKKNEMKMYTAKDFENDKKLPVGMIMIGTNWCGFCQALKPTWKQLYKDSKEHTIGAIDAMKNQELVHMMGITGYPTILIVLNNGKLKEFFFRKCSSKNSDLLKFSAKVRFGEL